MKHFIRLVLHLKNQNLFKAKFSTFKEIAKNYGSYYKSKLELKSNLSKIFPGNCKFICVHIFLVCAESQTYGPQV